jgi:hypothetical protein
MMENEESPLVNNFVHYSLLIILQLTLLALRNMYDKKLKGKNNYCASDFQGSAPDPVQLQVAKESAVDTANG